MTAARDAFADGRLSDAIGEQRSAVEREPTAAARLFLFEMLVLADRLADARDVLADIDSDDPVWPETAASFRRLVRAVRRRNWLRRRPAFVYPPPRHATRRWNAARSVETGDTARGVRWVDRADAVTPEVSGFVDGREFTGLRDGDERFASLLEVFIDGGYVWLPFEQVRAVTLEPPRGVLDTVYRPAAIRLRDGQSLSVVLPLVYPLSAECGDEFALGEAVDWTSEGDGPVCGYGAKVYFVGEEELPLGQVRMIEVRA